MRQGWRILTAGYCHLWSEGATLDAIHAIHRHFQHQGFKDAELNQRVVRKHLGVGRTEDPLSAVVQDLVQFADLPVVSLGRRRTRST